MGSIRIISAFVLGVLAGLGVPRVAKPRPRGTKLGSNYKMVLVVNASLKMGKGKIGMCISARSHPVQKRKIKFLLYLGAQCAHGACGAIETSSRLKTEAWKSQGQPKVCLQASQSQVLELYKQAKAAGLNSCLIADAGRTQIAAGSRTVLAIGPDEIQKIDALTGNLKLL
jgi:PTH2 family peptidyl-tRNA hydrolase